MEKDETVLHPGNRDTSKLINPWLHRTRM